MLNQTVGLPFNKVLRKVKPKVSKKAKKALIILLFLMKHLPKIR
jgi:hypothetical protein